MMIRLCCSILPTGSEIGRSARLRQFGEPAARYRFLRGLEPSALLLIEFSKIAEQSRRRDESSTGSRDSNRRIR
jgi:hypothetical protein